MVFEASLFLSPSPQWLDADDDLLPASTVEDLVASTGGDGDGDGDDGAVPLDGKGLDNHMVHPAFSDVEDDLPSLSFLLHPSCFYLSVGN